MPLRAALWCAVLLALAAPRPAAQDRITTPREHFGFDLGDDYTLANYQQMAAFWRTLAAESDRMILEEIGRTSEDRPHLMAIVTSPDNHRNLGRYKQIAQRLALARDVSADEARALAREGRAVVWIDGGLHANETLGAQQLAQMVYEMVSRTDEETLRFLDETIVLFVHANPDGHDLVADWYMRHPDPQRRTIAGLPRLYHHYIGHDNNRDFFASTQRETENINRILYHEWLPQILYNHHQSGPAGTVVWSSPQRDPYNYNLDPLVVLGLQALGTHMHQRLAAEGKPGATMASGGPYDGWWNGGIRNTANFHNILAILTETIGSPTPMRIPFVAARQIPNRDLPYPIAPQEWRFRQSVEYSIAFNRAVIDYAARNREHLLYNIWRMGQRAIDRGSRDHWTPSPSRINAVADRPDAAWAELRRPELRDPRAFVIPADQPDFLTAVKFVNALREVNVEVHRALKDFVAGTRKYPAGSFVVMTAQAFRPHVLDMFEPQDHPNVIPYPGAPPTPPYDTAGWTLAFQMGVRFDRFLEPVAGPFERVTGWNVAPPPGRVTTGRGHRSLTLARETNDASRVVNRMLAAGEAVTMAPDVFYFGSGGDSTRRLQAISQELGVTIQSVPVASRAARLRAPRIGLWDQYGGSMPSGWTRWILEQFEFPFARVFPQELDAGGLADRYDILIFVTGAIPATAGGPGAGPGGRGGGAPSAGPGQAGGPDPQDVPEEYRTHLGRITPERTIPRLREFVESGGTIVAIGSSAANLAAHFQLPIENHLVQNGQPLPRAQYFVPGSVLQARLDVTHPAAAGMQERTDFFFNNSPVFRVRPGADAVRPIATFDTATPLRSGWAWGQHHLDGGVAAAEVTVGKGRVLLYGPEILHRAQPHGTFKLLFNAIWESVAGR